MSFPKWTKAPYSVLTRSESCTCGSATWSWRSVISIGVTMCYLKIQAEGQWHIDRVERNWNWLDEELDGRLLPELSKGKVTDWTSIRLGTTSTGRGRRSSAGAKAS